MRQRKLQTCATVPRRKKESHPKSGSPPQGIRFRRLVAARALPRHRRARARGRAGDGGFRARRGRARWGGFVHHGRAGGQNQSTGRDDKE